MDPPTRRPAPLRRSAKLFVLGGLLAPGLLIESLDASAARPMQDQHVIIGHVYRLSTRTVWKALHCTGCDARPLDPSPDSTIVVEFIPDDASASVTLTIVGNATFVPPVTGTLRNPLVDNQRAPNYVLQAAAQYGCTQPYGDLQHFELVPQTGEP